MTPAEIIEYFGCRTEAANKIGVTYEAVRQWVHQNKIPQLRQCQIEIITGGTLSVDPELKADSASAGQ